MPWEARLPVGWLKKYFTQKRTVLCGLSLDSLSMLPLLGIFTIQGFGWYIMIYFSPGFFRVFGMLLYGHLKELYTSDLAGTAMTWTFFLSLPAVHSLCKSWGK